MGEWVCDFSKGGSHPGHWVLNLRQILWFRNKGDPLEQGWGVWYWKSWLLGALSLHYHLGLPCPVHPSSGGGPWTAARWMHVTRGHLSPVVRLKTHIAVHGFRGASWLAHMSVFLAGGIGLFSGETSMSLKQAF